MRRKDLDGSARIAPGIYIIDGDEGDPMGLVVHGPILDCEGGRDTALVLCHQLSRRTGRPASTVLVVDL